jgi:hypothetical protein
MLSEGVDGAEEEASSAAAEVLLVVMAAAAVVAPLGLTTRSKYTKCGGAVVVPFEGWILTWMPWQFEHRTWSLATMEWQFEHGHCFPGVEGEGGCFLSASSFEIDDLTLLEESSSTAVAAEPTSRPDPPSGLFLAPPRPPPTPPATATVPKLLNTVPMKESIGWCLVE